MMKKAGFSYYLIVALLSALLALTGCGGSDGSQGPKGDTGSTGSKGDTGATGEPGRNALATVAAVESCAVCHGAGKTNEPSHAVKTPRAASWSVTNVVVTPADPIAVPPVPEQVVLTVNIEDHGSALTGVRNVRAVWDDSGTTRSTNNASIAATSSVVKNADGTYTIRITPSATLTGGGWTAASDVAWRVAVNPTGGSSTYPEAMIVAYQNAGDTLLRNTMSVSNQACINCHGDNIHVDAQGTYMSNAVNNAGNPVGYGVHSGAHFSAYGVEGCLFCHGPNDRRVGATNTNLMLFAHAIHNSFSSGGPGGGTNGLDGKGPNYKTSIAIKNNWNFSVRYPGQIRDCAGCHDSDANMTHIMAKPVSFNTCNSCHGGANATTGKPWRGLSSTDGVFGGVNHSGFDSTTTCISCHDGNIAQATVGDYHGYTERGKAQALAQKYFNVNVTGVTPVDPAVTGAGAQYAMTWTVTDPTSTHTYDVCGTTAFNGTIDGGVAVSGNVTFAPLVRRAYFEPVGDDITNKGLNLSNGNTGQPGSSNVVGSTCAAGVVTTTFTVEAGIDESVTRMLAILKPQAGISGQTLQGTANRNNVAYGILRISAESYAFDLADGASKPRRPIVDSEKCIACHGSALYNHGATGGRFDNVDSCIACHNPAATDIGRRQLLFGGIEAGNAYDGKDAESFALAYNMHRIHSAGVTNAFYSIYRSNGIYGYGGRDTKPDADWPLDDSGEPRVYVSNTADYNPLTPKTAHYIKQVDYPQPLQNCTACHDNAWVAGLPDQTKAVAISVNAPVSDIVGGIQDQNRHTQMGSSAASCVSCHATIPAKAHIGQNSWKPSVLPKGKEDALKGRTVIEVIAE